MELRLIISVILSVLLLNFSNVYAQSTENSGEQLERNIFKTVTEKNWQALEDMISPEVQSINADKIRNRTELIAYIKKLNFAHYKFSNFTVTQDTTGNIIVITYEMTYNEKIGKHPQSGKKIKNLSVWRKDNDKWQWIAHAVID